MKEALRAMVVAAGLFAAAAAHGQFGFTLHDANVRAGPARDFPLVAWLPVGTVVRIFGCIDGWRWCEIGTDQLRGFVYAGFLGYPYDNGYVSVREAGPYLGLPVVTFVLQHYWGSWYHDRPWYPEWRRWASRPTARPHDWVAPQRPPAARPMPPIVGPPPIGAVPPTGSPVQPFDLSGPSMRPPPAAISRPQPAPPGTRPEPRPVPGRR